MAFTFSEYKQFLKDHDHLQTEIDWAVRGRKIPVQELTRKRYLEFPAYYRTQFPLQVLAVCPICNKTVSEGIDTFSLAGCGWWMHEQQGSGWFGRRFFTDELTLRKTNNEITYTTECKCVQAVMYGINLNGILPDDVRVDDVYLSSEIPNVLTPFMEKEDSYAVLHTIPIGRLTDSVWEPRYTAYFVTYFSKNPDAFKEAVSPSDPYHRDFIWPYQNLDYQLEKWIEKGKLFWLNKENVLENSPECPYLNWQGLVGRWKIKYGRLVLVPENLCGSDLLNSNHPFWRKSEEIAKSILEKNTYRKL